MEFKKALAQNPLLREAHLYLGHIYHHRGRRKEARQHYQKAKELGLTEPISIFNLAWKYKECNRNKEAIELFNKAINTKGLDKGTLLKARLSLGWLYYNQKAYQESIRQYQEALKIDNSLAKAHYWLGKVYKASGDREAARREWQKVLKIDPDHKGAKAQLADN